MHGSPDQRDGGVRSRTPRRRRAVRPGSEQATEPEHWRWECCEDDEPLDVDLAIASGHEILTHGEHWRAGLRSVEQYPTHSVGPLSHLPIDAEEVSPQVARHLARHDPASTARAVESSRLLIAEILSYRHDYNDADSYYSCSQAVSSWNGDSEPGSGCGDDDRRGKPCDCGRDRRVKRVLAIIVSRWAGHPDYQVEEWKP